MRCHHCKSRTAVHGCGLCSEPDTTGSASWVPPSTGTVCTRRAPRNCPRHLTGGTPRHSPLPFCSQAPCWILKDCMMKKCALRITYRSMQFLILPHALDNSFKSQFIACSLTFHKLRAVSWTLKKKKQNQSKQNPNQPCFFFHSGVFGEKESKGRKSGCFSKSKRIGLNGCKDESNCSQCSFVSGAGPACAGPREWNSTRCWEGQAAWLTPLCRQAVLCSQPSRTAVTATGVPLKENTQKL